MFALVWYIYFLVLDVMSYSYRKKEPLKDKVPRALPLDRFELIKTNIKKKKERRRMDHYLPFLDSERLSKPDPEYEAAVDLLVKRELEAITQGQSKLHPVAQKIADYVANSITYRFGDELFQEYLAHNETKGPKRQRVDSQSEDVDNEDQFLEYYKRKVPRIDLVKYSDDANVSFKQLAITESYLHHQLITLESLLPETLIKQWSVNNEFMEQSDSTIRSEIERQRKQLSDLDAYRRQIQLQHRETFETLQDRIDKAVLDKLEMACIPKGK